MLRPDKAKVSMKSGLLLICRGNGVTGCEDVRGSGGGYLLQHGPVVGLQLTELPLQRLQPLLPAGHRQL